MEKNSKNCTSTRDNGLYSTESHRKRNYICSMFEMKHRGMPLSRRCQQQQQQFPIEPTETETHRQTVK